MSDEPMFVHCASCMDNRPDELSPAEWSSLEVVLREDAEGQMWLLVGCKRCQKLVGSFQVLFTPGRICGICGECHDEETVH